jgi:hypothetical protein
LSQSDAKKEAINIALEKLNGTDLNERSALLSLGIPEDGMLAINAFGKTYLVNERTYEITCAIGEMPSDEEKILILHYLLCEIPYRASENMISFREFKGGQFYLDPFISRTTHQLVNCYGNDLVLLKKNLNLYECIPMNIADVSAKIHAIGNIHIYLIYHAGNDEFPPKADILFDDYAKWVYNAKDAVRLASRICFGLIRMVHKTGMLNG